MTLALLQVSVSEPFALNVKSNKQKLRSHVEAVKGTSATLPRIPQKGCFVFFLQCCRSRGGAMRLGSCTELVQRRQIFKNVINVNHNFSYKNLKIRKALCLGLFIFKKAGLL
jgi:hypothetical protein